jgi:hypothetical protein
VYEIKTLVETKVVRLESVVNDAKPMKKVTYVSRLSADWSQKRVGNLYSIHFGLATSVQSVKENGRKSTTYGGFGG